MRGMIDSMASAEKKAWFTFVWWYDTTNESAECKTKDKENLSMI